MSAADAEAEGDKVGIGGWLCIKKGVRRFFRMLVHAGDNNSLARIPQQKSKVDGLRRNSNPASNGHLSFAMPAGSDNAPTEAEVHKHFHRRVHSWHLPAAGNLVTHSLSIPSQPRFRQVQRADKLRRVKLDRFR